MRLRRVLGLGLLVALAVGAAQAADGDAPLVVVGRDLADVGPTLAGFRLQARTVASIAAAPVDARTILVLADSTLAPRVLSAADCARLEGLASRGARVFVEFARPETGVWLGGTWATEARRPLYERLVVLQPLGALKPEDLLEEHDGACLPLASLPPGAQALLEYDRALGTYDRVPWPEQGVFSVTVDLGSAQPLASVTQRFGAGEPNYRPESVELWLSGDGQEFTRAGRVDSVTDETVGFELQGKPARLVRLVARKLKRGRVADFFFMGEITALSPAGRNVALHRPYTLTPADAQAGGYQDSGGRLTDGVIEGKWDDRLSVGFATPTPREETRFPALVRVPVGLGEVLLCAPKISDFRRRHFRLTERWEELWRQIVLELRPPEARAGIAARHVPLEAHTDPRVWVEPEASVKLIVTTSPEAAVTSPGLKLVKVGEARWEAAFTAQPGEHVLTVEAKTPTGSATAAAKLDCRPRREKYRQALDRNMRWFERSGVLPKADGSGGVYSQVCMAWLDSQPVGYDFLASPFRVDCNAMTAEAFGLYGLLTKDPRYMQIAANLGQTVVAHQYSDPTKASLGGFPWLYERDNCIFFWDDNSRIGNALLWLYHWTEKPEFLRAALRGGELFRQVARDDGCVHRHAITQPDLDRLGREGYRQFSQGADPDYRLTHWLDLAAVTGDAEYERLGRQVAESWGGGLEGLAHALAYAPDEKTRQRLHGMAQGFLDGIPKRPYPLPTVGGGGYELAFVGDCNIATRDGEPLTDQIYGTPWTFRAALRAWKAADDDASRQMCELFGDYLVRIQTEDPDPRLDGCWMRGFDVERWETYGAPYDPAYGPYSAYTGWMNAVADQAFAWVLLEEKSFIPRGQHPEAAAVLQSVRALTPKLVADGPNLALGCRYTLDAPVAGAYMGDGKKLTDGIIDGSYEDHRAVGWSMARVGDTLTKAMTLDLGQPRTIKLITQQYGAGRGDYNPDRVVVTASDDGQEYRPVRELRFGSTGAALLWLMLEEPLTARYVRFELHKQRRDDVTDFLFVGETKAFAPLAP